MLKSHYRLISTLLLAIVFLLLVSYNLLIDLFLQFFYRLSLTFKVECSMALQADQRDYKIAFQKHLHAYTNWKDTGSIPSKRLILAYCVECGLKYVIMKQENIFRTSDAQDDIAKELSSHNYRKLLKRLNQIGIYAFPAIKTNHNDDVHPETYHEFCRYCIKPGDKYVEAVQQYDKTFEEIVEWIKERI